MVIVFDVMGTLLSPAVLSPLVRRVTRGKMKVQQFFSEVTYYAMANTLTGEHPPFESVAAAVLQMVATRHGKQAGETDQYKLRQGLRSMQPFDDVKPALRRLQDHGLRLAVLSNANTDLLEEQLKRTKLKKFFEQTISVDAIARQFKPAREVYQSALERLGGDAHEMLMVAAHPWDLLGASRVGCRTAFITRQDKAPYPGEAEPNYKATDLAEFADELLGPETEKPIGNNWLLATAGVALGLGLASTATIGPNSPLRVR